MKNTIKKLLSFQREYLLLVVSIFVTVSLSSHAGENQVNITVQNGERCFSSNGIPDHPTGTFPNRGNPHKISEQKIDLCVNASPHKKNKITTIRGTVGIAINGVQFRPNTAGFWDSSSPRGHSRQGDRNWSLDIHGARGKLGLDFNNAHVGRGGLYHYHGIADSLTATSGSSLVGYARDGFEIHYLNEQKKSGWILKQGTRPSNGPPGPYDGTYNEDYIYTGGLNKLDQCNGGTISGHYAYFITNTYPFVPRCLQGIVSADFNLLGTF
jgi:hypothetical protein|tara:strand:+ start:222 stop:1025 length:804 start_codon:yes stop_codon:yes gene_type:complete